MFTYFLLRSGVSPSFKGDEVVRVQPVRPPCMSTSVELHRYVRNYIIYMYYPSCL
jgi:hypothetical protein